MTTTTTDTISTGTDFTPDPDTDIVVFSKPGCVQCNATMRTLRRNNIEFQHVDISQDLVAFKYATSLGDYSQAPVVLNTTNGDSWMGFRPDKIDEYLDAHIPATAAAA